MSNKRCFISVRMPSLGGLFYKLHKIFTLKVSLVVVIWPSLLFVYSRSSSAILGEHNRNACPIELDIISYFLSIFDACCRNNKYFVGKVIDFPEYSLISWLFTNGTYFFKDGQIVQEQWEFIQIYLRDYSIILSCR